MLPTTRFEKCKNGKTGVDMLPRTRFEKCTNGKTGVDERCRDAGRGGDAEGTPQSIGEPNGERPFCLHHCQYHHYHCNNYPHRGAVLIF